MISSAGGCWRMQHASNKNVLARFAGHASMLRTAWVCFLPTKEKKSLAPCTGACQQVCATRTNRIACLPRAPSRRTSLAKHGAARTDLAWRRRRRYFHASLSESDARAANISRLLLFLSEEKGRRIASQTRWAPGIGRAPPKG
jgi:hypothetical protein